MSVSPRTSFLLFSVFARAACSVVAVPAEVALPEGVRAVWDLAKAAHETTTTRERICLNGLWRWQPADAKSDQVPAENWGWFKVPGCWPGITDYMQKDCQTVYAHPAWKEQKLGSVTAAWYQREFEVPAEWSSRQVALQLDDLNSYAAVWVDGKSAGEIRFPAGEVDLSTFCPAGTKHVLSLLVVAMPMKGVMQSYTDSAHAREVVGKVERRGLCGDVFLIGRPTGPRLGAVTVETSTRRGEVTFSAVLENLKPEGHYALWVRVGKNGAMEPASPAFHTRDLQDGRYRFTTKWTLPPQRWDLHTPGNLHDAQFSLREAPSGQVLDEQLPVRFGFREFWINGRDFYLNGSRIHLSAVPLDNAQISAGLASYAGAKETLQRLKGIGINFVYTHHYGCEPGAHLALEEILRAADDVGMLVCITQPHFSHYDWKAADADEKNGYAAHATYYAQVAGSHPSVVTYAMSHNATGYEEDLNPDLIDGVHDPRDNWASKNAKLALRAEAIVKRLDPSRLVYHHASGNLGSMHVMNFYLNFVPIQELSDWYEHWSKEGVKPAFMCEYGVPFTWDWTMYRGWYQGKREWGSANVPWEFCVAEWNSLLLGDGAYHISDAEKANLRWEAKQFRTSQGWHRWDYPNPVGSERFDERYPVFAKYITDNWRAFRTWGVSAISPWEYGHYWKLREGVDRRRVELPTDWERLQRPGFSPDYRDQQMDRMDVAYERADWVATPAAQALLRNNRPVLGYLGGKEAAFTSKDHHFLPGEIVEKQLIALSDAREPIACDIAWNFALPQPLAGKEHVVLQPGQQIGVPLRLPLPATLAPGTYALTASFDFTNGESQGDRFTIDVLPAPAKPPVPYIGIFDPKGKTKKWLKENGISAVDMGSEDQFLQPDILIIGQGALTTKNAIPGLDRDPGRPSKCVLIFEQSAEALEERFGFRVAEYGLRQVFPRAPLTSVLKTDLAPERLHDWNGAATLNPPRLTYELRPMHGPTVHWCGLPVSRAWRCGNRGNVASVTIEKPAAGDFLSLVDGGYGLHYSALLRCRQGAQVIYFCQLDVTGRTETDPAAETIVRDLLMTANIQPTIQWREAVYLGEPAGYTHLHAAGFAVRPYAVQPPAHGEVLVLGPGAARQAEGHAAEIQKWIQDGGQVLAVGLNQAEADVLLPLKVTFKKAEHIAATFDDTALPPPLRGIGPAEVYNRDPREMPLVTAGAKILGDGVLAVSENPNIVFCQMVPWQFDSVQPLPLRRTHRQASVLLARLLGNLNVGSTTPILERLKQPVADKQEQRWLAGLYLDQPEEWDDPYRFFRW